MYYYIESPGQIVSAMEAISFECDHSPKLFVRLNSGLTNNSQIKNTLLFYQDKLNFEYIFINGIVDFIIKVVPIYVLSKSKLFIGCHKSKYIKILKLFRLKLVLLDDGIASLIYIKNGGSDELFTCLNSKAGTSQKIVKHKFNFLKNVSESNGIKSNETLFFGAKYVEVGLLDVDDYCRILKKVKEINENLVYVAHRAESIDNLNIYRDLGIEVVNWSYPSEIELSLIQNKPRNIYGLYSAALISAKMLLPETNVVSIRIDFFTSNQDDINDVYGYMEQYVDVISL